MRLVLDPRAWRLWRRLPRPGIHGIIELALIAVLAVQLARLFWAVVTPIGPLGDWRTGDSLAGTVQSRAAALTGFDPFFRLQGGDGSAVVTALQLTLYGVRMNEATGRGSAIIAGPDKVQTSYAVGDTILPGVTLKAVAFDSVTILRGDAEETLFIDQSGPPPAAPTTAADAQVDSSLDGQAPAVAGSTALTAAQIQSGISFLPRVTAGRTTGFIVKAQGSGEAFRVAGFRDGDIITAVNGRPITAEDDLQRIASGLAGGGNIGVSVERGSDIVPIAIRVAGQ